MGQPNRAPSNRRLAVHRTAAILTALAVFAAGWGYGRYMIPSKTESTLYASSDSKTVFDLPTSNRGVKNILADILHKYSGGDRILAVAQWVEATPVSELGALIQQAAQCPDAAVRQHLVDFAYAKWVAADPPGALANALPTMRTTTPDRSPISGILGKWARIDPQTALGAALKLDNAAFRQDAVTKVLNQWVQGEDPLGALAALKSLPPNTAIANEERWLYQRWSEVDPLAAWVHVGEIANAEMRSTVQGIILSNLAYSDPIEAVRLLNGLPTNQKSPQIYLHVFQAWSRQDHDAAYAALRDLPVGSTRTAAVDGAFNGWAEVDPLAALRAAQQFPPGPDRDKAIELALPNFALQDSQAAGEYLASLPPGTVRNNLVNRLVAGLWADADPSAALTWLDKNTSGSTHDAAVSEVLGKIVNLDPEAAMAYIVQMAPSALSEKYLQDSLANWGKQDPAAAMAWAQANLSGNAQDTAFAAVLPLLVQANPMAAMDYVRQLAMGATRDKAIASLAASMAREDIQGAINWVRNLPDTVSGTARSNALAGIINTWAKADPASAAAFVRDNNQNTNYNALAGNLAQNWAKTYPKEALAWAETLPGEARESTVGAALVGMAVSDGPGAWANAIEYWRTEGYTNQFQGIIYAWSRTDPAASAQAMASLPEDTLGQVSTNTANFLITEWMSSDPAIATEWVKHLPPGSLHDAALARYNQMQQANAIFKNSGGISMNVHNQSITISPGLSQSGVGMRVPRDDEAPRQLIAVPLAPASGLDTSR